MKLRKTQLSQKAPPPLTNRLGSSKGLHRDGGALSRVRLEISYDGTGFAGWARQPGLRTVQGVLEDAIATVLRCESVSLTVAGRTDAGVHATGQVAHVDVPPEVLYRLRGGADAMAARVNRLLGAESDVVLTHSQEVASTFDARFSATWRRYRYRIADASVTPNPLRRHDTVTITQQLDVSEMQRLGRKLLGLGDFATFCKSRPEATTIRELQAFEWHRVDDGVFVAELRADAFCHSMVRALVGAAVAVGSGRLSVDRVIELRDNAERTSEFKVLPAKGLTLVEVGYPDELEWAARANLIRAKRTLGV